MTEPVELVVSVTASGRGPFLWHGPRMRYTLGDLPDDLWEAFAAGDVRLVVRDGTGLLERRTVYTAGEADV